jgi:branched-chain amino acid transport system substrate-binding protein
MKKFYRILISLFLAGFVSAQNFSVDIENDFKNALDFYKSKQLENALQLFQKIADRSENNSKQSVSVFFISKILTDQKKYSEAEKNSQNFLQNYPKSKYSDEVKLLIINSFIVRNDYRSAFKSTLEYLENSTSVLFEKELKSIADKIAYNDLSSSEFEKFYPASENSELRSFLLLLNGKILLNEGKISEASKKFTEITTKHITSDEYIEALNLNKKYSSYNSESEYPVVGVILSLTDQNGREIESANEILEGIKFAFHEYNTSNSDKIGLLINDVERDRNKILITIDEFVNNSDIRCIIGPIFSDDVRYALSEINNSNLCLISPTATDADLITLSDNFYQANPSIAMRGKVFAQYLYFVESKRKLAVLNAIEGYSPLLAASFTKEFESLGGKIIAKETYKSKSYSLSDQLNRIAVIKNSIEGIYAPISDPNDANAILSQTVQSGLEINIYGNQDWFLGKGFESSSTSANKLTFESDYFIDFNDQDFKNFSVRFKKITDKGTGRNVLYGYDIAKYLLTVMRNIDPTRKNIKFKIESGINVSGYHNNISFDSERINKYLNIVRYQDEVFELVEKFRSGK